MRAIRVAATLNRLGLKTGTGNTWNERRARIVPCPPQRSVLDHHLEGGVERLGISHKVVR